MVCHQNIQDLIKASLRRCEVSFQQRQVTEVTHRFKKVAIIKFIQELHDNMQQGSTDALSIQSLHLDGNAEGILVVLGSRRVVS